MKKYLAIFTLLFIINACFTLSISKRDKSKTKKPQSNKSKSFTKKTKVDQECGIMGCKKCTPFTGDVTKKTIKVYTDEKQNEISQQFDITGNCDKCNADYYLVDNMFCSIDRILGSKDIKTYSIFKKK